MVEPVLSKKHTVVESSVVIRSETVQHVTNTIAVGTRRWCPSSIKARSVPWRYRKEGGRSPDSVTLYESVWDFVWALSSYSLTIMLPMSSGASQTQSTILPIQCVGTHWLFVVGALVRLATVMGDYALHCQVVGFFFLASFLSVF